MIQVKSSTDPIFQQAGDLAALLRGNKSILVSTHVSPDGDAIASVLAAAEIIRQLQSRPVGVLDGTVPARYLFLPGAGDILRPQDHSTYSSFQPWDATLILDCGSLTRIGQVAEIIPAGTPIINVDHHPDNTRFGDLNIVRPEASSTAEILFDLAISLELPLTPHLAMPLYIGLMTDTGAFRFSNASQKAFAMATRLVGAGVDPAEMAQAVYCTNTAQSLRLLGGALGSLELWADGRIATITAQEWAAGEEFEDALELVLTIKGVQAAAFFRMSNGTCRVSLRARGDYDVARIARQLGGGGHQKAAGCTLKSSVEEVRAQVIAALREEIGDLSPHLADPA